MTELRAEEYSRRSEQIEGWDVIVESHRLGDTWHCTISSADPGARFARASGASRDEAEGAAREKAARRLAGTRRHS